MHTFVIAEIGSAWRWEFAGTTTEAREAIAIAKSCGADAIKFQWTSNPREMEQRRHVKQGSYDILAWGENKLDFIARECRESCIEFMCTVFLPCDVAILNPYVKRWKVASLESVSEGLLDAIYKTHKPMIVSAGAMGFVMLPPALNADTLHCTASYPAPLDQLNLKAIRSYSGYSDHSGNTLTGALAVACGAKIVEVHFKLFNTPRDNPDYGHSLCQPELRQYIANIRQAELMLGDGVKKVEKCEEWALKHKVKA